MSSAQQGDLRDRVAGFPASPGVYLMKNAAGKVIYVGKARSLSARVRSYLQRPEALEPKTAALMSAARSVDYIATDSEVEALVLECTLIKEYRPRYNVRLKDDKRYPYLKLTMGEEFPRLLLVRSVDDDGAEYFGPFTDSRAVRRTLKTLRRVFPLRDCGPAPGRAGGRECLNFHIGHCPAPCTGRIGAEEYRETAENVRLFLRGKRAGLAATMRERMWRLSREKRYEDAASLRDQIAALESVTERQHAVTPGGDDEDVAAIAREGARACGVILKVREGRILGQETFLLPASELDWDREILQAFLELYYHGAADVPPRIVVPEALEDGALIERWLGERTGRRVRISTPARGDRKALVGLAVKNAAFQIASLTQTRAASVPALRELKEALGLPGTPARIEAFDISNIQGSDAVGSMVTFVRASPLKSGYRRFKIRGAEGADDYAMMREVLSRRLARLGAGEERRPDLILVDGGKGQVSAAGDAIAASGLRPIPLAGLAKRHEEIYLEGRAEPLRLPRRSRALRLLQRIRDEAHRFAVEYHRSLRGKRMRSSGLDAVAGIGRKRRTALLAAFGSVEALKRADSDDIAAVPGIGPKTAAAIREALHEKK
jgi:excinuclease ABC subunit C